MSAGEWTRVRIEMLRRLWGEGKTASQCAAAINTAFGAPLSRNAIIGKAGRLGLAGRPSPIKGEKAAIAARRNAAITGPRAGKPNPARLTKNQRAGIVMNAVRTARPNIATANGVAVKPAPRPTARRADGYRTCQWPIGDPKEPTFHFCDAKPVMKGKPYCAEHCDKAYQRIAQPAESEAA